MSSEEGAAGSAARRSGGSAGRGTRAGRTVRLDASQVLSPAAAKVTGTPAAFRSSFGKEQKFDSGWKPADNGPVLGSAEYVLAEAAAASRSFKQPHLHILGEIMGGEGFPEGCACRFAVEAGGSGDRAWEKSEGDDVGQTQVAYGSDSGGDERETVWAHPLDVHYLAGSLRGWPRLILEVWCLDDAGRMELTGYGFCHIPSTPGSHDVDIPTWRPVGTPVQELTAAFLGGTPRLARASYVYTRRTERHELLTAGSGTVKVHFDIVMRNFATHGVEMA